MIPRRAALAWSAATIITVAAAPAYATSIDTTCVASGCKEPGTARRKTYRLTTTCALTVTRVWIDDCPASLEDGIWTLRDHPDSSSPLPVVIETAAGRQVLRVHFKPCKEN